MAKQVSNTKIQTKAKRYVMKYRNAKTVAEKVDVSTALTILSVAQHMTDAQASELINLAETLIR
jgi:hypothetical protein